MCYTENEDIKKRLSNVGYTFGSPPLDLLQSSSSSQTIQSCFICHNTNPTINYQGCVFVESFTRESGIDDFLGPREFYGGQEKLRNKLTDIIPLKK